MARANPIPEQMDNLALDPAELTQALQGLERLNKISRSASLLWPPIRKQFLNYPQAVRVLDIASGGGDVPLSLVQLAKKNGVTMEITLSDINEGSLRYAKEKGKRIGIPVSTLLCDVLTDEIPRGFDIITCSLFLHHLNDKEILSVLNKIHAAHPKCIVINDLHRSRLNYLLTYFATRVLSRSPIVHYDGPCSVLNSFSKKEMRELLQEAGFTNFSIDSHFPCRLLASCRLDSTDGT